ncbi:MAG: peptide chain release factor 2 [Pontimonas sp.]|jgi:peptide chain release factor 2
MSELEIPARIVALASMFNTIEAVLDPYALKTEIARLSGLAVEPDLWEDVTRAQAITSALSHRQSELTRIDDVRARLDDLDVLVRMASEEADDGLAQEVLDEVVQLEELLGAMEIQTLLDGEFDASPAIVTIRSGAGGVDAADFAEMLLRMYVRWSESHGFSVSVLDTSYAEEAGIKSATVQIDGPYAFGTLSVEAGTHRLVRMSPFNSAGKRQTSFAAVEVVPLMEEATESDIPESEMRVDVFRSSGPGGQSVNTTDSAVRITHLPSGVVVSCQNEKSQIQNKASALRVLKSRLLLIAKEAEAAKKKEIAGVITASWGDQMRSYVLAPYQMVKDLRSEHEVNNPSAVFDGDIDGFLQAGIRWRKSAQRVS